jgi:hypothetical protein
MEVPGLAQAESAVDAIVSAVAAAQGSMPAMSASSFAVPTPPTMKLSGISLQGLEGALQLPVDDVTDVTVPTTVQLPNLTVPAFSTAASTVRLAFSAPVLSAVSYKTGISAPAPSYGVSTEAPTFEPAQYAGTVAPPDVSVVFSTIPELQDVRLLDIARHIFANADLAPIRDLEIPEPPEVNLQPGDIDVGALNQGWAAEFAPTISQHFQSGAYVQFMDRAAMETYVEAKTRPQRVNLLAKKRAILAAHAAKGFNSAVGALTSEFIELAREEADMVVAANDEARRETQQLVGAAMLANASLGFKLESSAIDLWSKWAMAPVQLASKYNASAIQIAKNLVSVYNDNVSLISEHVQTYQAYAKTGRDIVQAQIAEATQDQYIAENYANVIELFRARTRHWVSEVRQYALKVKGATLPVEAYQVFIASLMIDAQIARSNISMYADAVSTFGERTKLYADNLELWADTYRADGSKFSVDVANLQAYRQAIGDEQDRIRAYLQYVDASTDAFNAKTSEMGAALQANSIFLDTLGDMVNVAKDYTELSSRAVSANARAQSGVASADAAYRSGQFSVLMNKYATDLAVNAANNQIEVSNKTYSKQGDQIRMAALSSYIQGLYSSVVQSVSADVRYSGESQFSGSESLSEDTKSAWQSSVRNTNRYVIEPSV